MEDVRVTWSGFEYNLKGSLAKLREMEVLYDVHIVCEGQFIPAHQVVLGSSSPQLLSLITHARGITKQPFLVLRGVEAADIQLIMEFIYTGQVVVPQERLNSFLATAEDLEILGLSKKCANIHIGSELDDYDLSEIELPSISRKRAKRKRNKNGASEAEIDVKEESIYEDEPKGKREKRTDPAGAADKQYECEACNKKFFRKAHLMRHEKVHTDFRPFVCTLCEQKFKRKEHCLKHVTTIHDVDDPQRLTEEIKLSEVMEAIDNVQSDQEESMGAGNDSLEAELNPAKQEL